MKSPLLYRGLGLLLTPLFLLLLVATLILWHPLIVFSRRLNPTLHKNIIEAGNLLLVLYLRIMGGSLAVEWAADAPRAGPVILVSNHQSYFDIPIFIWVFRRYYVKFVAKRSLGKWLPSISFVLRSGGSALINRGNPNQALPRIEALGRLISEQRCAACIFPEGTRARDGRLRFLRPSGLQTLLAAAPEAPVLPVAIDGAWELMRYKLMPVPFGVRVTVRIFSPISRKDYSNEEIIARCTEVLRAALPDSRLN